MTRVIGILLMALVLAGTTPLIAQEQRQSPSSDTAGTLVDLNTASLSQLQALPGVGPRTAERIIEYRNENGGFRKPEDLMNVRGIGEKSFLRLKDLITVGPPRTDAASGGSDR